MTKRRRSLVVISVLILSHTGAAQTVIPLINSPATGQLGIAVKLGRNTNTFTYLLDTGSAGFFSACGTNSAWAGLVSGGRLGSGFHITYGDGSLAYRGDVVITDLTFTDEGGNPFLVPNVRVGIITNEPYLGWNENINHVVNGVPSPIAPEPNSQTTHLFYGTLGAGLFQTAPANGSLGTVLGQIPVPAGLIQGFIIHTGGSASASPKLTVGLTQADLAAFPILISMNPATGAVTNYNGTIVTLYPESQATATCAITNGSFGYTAQANLMMDSGGQGTHITTGTSINPPVAILSPDGSRIADGSSFAAQAPGVLPPGGTVAGAGLDWQISPAGETLYVDRIAVLSGSSVGSLNSGIALFYEYDVLFDTEHGIIGLRSILPRPALSLAFAAGTSQLQLSWPASAAGFGLQVATTLANGGDWQDAGNPTSTNGQNVVTVEAGVQAAFFRLRK